MKPIRKKKKYRKKKNTNQFVRSLFVVKKNYIKRNIRPVILTSVVLALINLTLKKYLRTTLISLASYVRPTRTNALPSPLASSKAIEKYTTRSDTRTRTGTYM